MVAELGQCRLPSAVLATLAVLARGHSWVACTDYRGDVNYFEQDKCAGWPRGYRPTPRAKGYQIASPESRAWGNGGCDRPMAKPDWRAGYSEAFPHAVYEAGRVYCLAWPMKNHATAPASCTNGHAKSDPGLSESLILLVSSRDPDSDPRQAEFYQRNINELAGLAIGCNHTWTEKDAGGSQELADQCQLGLERHRTGELDCNGFQRSPKFCENTGEAMGTGCFMVPADFTPGHYVGQWVWGATFPSRGSYSYQTCFDFEAVPRGASSARPGVPGTTGVAESDLPCRNNVDKFRELGVDVGPIVRPQPLPEQPRTTTLSSGWQPTLTQAPPQAPSAAQPGECFGPHEHCAQPGSSRPGCCVPGYECKFWNQDWARCRPRAQSSDPEPEPEAEEGAEGVPEAEVESEAEEQEEEQEERQEEEQEEEEEEEEQEGDLGQEEEKREDNQEIQSPTHSTASPLACAMPHEHCAGPPGWWTGPTCCTAGHACVFANEHWARCLPRPGLVEVQTSQKRGFLAKVRALMQLSESVASGYRLPPEDEL